jgi:hypothetical protein
MELVGSVASFRGVASLDHTITKVLEGRKSQAVVARERESTASANQRREGGIVFVETLLRRVVDLAEEYPKGEVPDRVLWEEPGDDYDEYMEAAKRLEGEGLVESGTSDYATLRATEKGRKAIRGFRG